MNFFVNHQHQGYDPSSQSQESYNQSTNNYYPYSYSYPNRQFSSSINPYTCQNPIVQPSQHEEQEPNPPGVTPTPLPELSQNSYFQYHAHGAAVGVPPVGTQPGAVVHQSTVQPLQAGVGNMGGIVPRGDGPIYPFPVSGLGRGHPLPMNAAIPFQDQTVITHGGFHVQGGPSQQSFGGPRQKFSSGRSNRVRGRGRGKHVAAPAQSKPGGPVTESSSTQKLVALQSPSVLPPPKAVSCELCKVECNTLEILQQHMNGKKHKKKLKVLEELQTINKRTEQISTTELKTKGVPSQPNPLEILPCPKTNEHCPSQPNPVEILSSQEINEECKVAGEKRKIEEAEPPPEESAKKTKVGGPTKRKLKGGKSNRKMNRSKSSVQPSKPKEAAPVPLICELCNVKCESVVVFQSHLAGKKHKSKAKQFLGQQAMQAVDRNNGDGSSLSMQIQA